jgi:hypothetical protein
MMDNLLDTFIEVEPLNSDQFFTVKETLTRMGLVSRKEGEIKPTLWQSCHILHKKGKYYLLHFKQLFQLDGKSKKTNFTQEDQDRTKLIAHLLQDWGLVTLKEELDVKENSDVVVISFSEKPNWNCRAKYTIGNKKINQLNDE